MRYTACDPVLIEGVYLNPVVSAFDQRSNALFINLAPHDHIAVVELIRSVTPRMLYPSTSSAGLTVTVKSRSLIRLTVAFAGAGVSPFPLPKTRNPETQGATS